jgi:hypothetical protein
MNAQDGLGAFHIPKARWDSYGVFQRKRKYVLHECAENRPNKDINTKG